MARHKLIEPASQLLQRKHSRLCLLLLNNPQQVCSQFCQLGLLLIPDWSVTLEHVHPSIHADHQPGRLDPKLHIRELRRVQLARAKTIDPFLLATSKVVFSTGDLAVATRRAHPEIRSHRTRLAILLSSFPLCHRTFCLVCLLSLSISADQSIC